MKRLPAAVTVLCAILVNGCGTVCNFAGGILHPDREPRVYGGVQRDVEVIEEMSKPPGLGLSAGKSAAGALVFLGVVLVDPAISFVADTLTLPITLYAEHRREAAYMKSGGGTIVESPSAPAEAATLGTPRPLE